MNSSEKQNPKITPCYPHVIPMLSHGFTVPHCQAPPDSATAEVPDSAPQAGADSGAGSVRRPRGGPGEAQRPRDGMVLGTSIDFDFYRYRMI